MTSAFVGPAGGQVGAGGTTLADLIERLRIELHAPGIWQEPAVWLVKPHTAMFECPEHGVIPWFETSHDTKHARAEQPEQSSFNGVRHPVVRREWFRSKHGVLR